MLQTIKTVNKNLFTTVLILGCIIAAGVAIYLGINNAEILNNY